MRKRRWLAAGGLLILAGAGLFAYHFDLIPAREVEDGDYPMRAVSVFTEDKRAGIQYLTRGRQAWLHLDSDTEVIWVDEETRRHSVADKEVKACPKLQSSRPLHGVVEFGDIPSETEVAMRFHFVVDESSGTGTGYDRLYFDADRDLDLTNQPALVPMADPPAPSHHYHHWGENVVFGPLSIPFDFGPGIGMKPVEILPRLNAEDQKLSMYFVAREARKGKIQIGRRRYEAVLAHTWRITGRYDVPGTELYLRTTGLRRVRQSWWGADYLSAFRLVDGRFYTISATPAGDCLKVRAYRGDLGVFRISPGNRQIDEVAVSGSLGSESSALPVGELSHGSNYSSSVKRCELPVGDYRPEALSVTYGRLRIFLSWNYHSDGKRRGGIDEPPVFGIEIRKDRPYVLDFSHDPEVMFTSPAKDQTFKPGDEVEVAAVLIDPVLSIMIRNLYDTSRKEPRTINLGNGKTTTREQIVSLDPVVTITDSTGKTVSEGKMPFG